MNNPQTQHDLERDLLEQAATIRYAERTFLSAQLSKYSAILFTLIALLLTPVLENILPVIPGIIWIAIAYYRQQAAAQQLVVLERDKIVIQRKLNQPLDSL
ncbi:MAG: hypothetical protein KDE56_18010 [Anaerolineales bacterium]|nr:hypothetical protein [Anaerolineales bacterium]